jgi:hypothetical protein
VVAVPVAVGVQIVHLEPRPEVVVGLAAGAGDGGIDGEVPTKWRSPVVGADGEHCQSAVPVPRRRKATSRWNRPNSRR